MATASFLASRAVPSGGFFVALAGGTALASLARARGAREAFGASIAATLETVALMGPARFGVPFTQAVSAPMLGAMEGAGRSWRAQYWVCFAVRMITNAIGAAFAILVIVGGLEPYAETIDNVVERVGLSLGVGGVLAVSGASMVVWGLFASWVQLSFYQRGLRGRRSTKADDLGGDAVSSGEAGRFDPRAASLATVIAFALLLSGTEWPVLGAVTAWLAPAWLLSKPDPSPVRTGVVLGAALAGGAFLFSMGGGLGLEEAASRAARAALLIAVATWLRAAARADGLREVFRRSLSRLRAVPAVPEAARTLDSLGSERALARSGRALIGALDDVALRPAPFADAVLDWVADRAGRFRPGAPPEPRVMRLRVRDAALVLAALAPVAALV